jgi:hypothetical protein
LWGDGATTWQSLSTDAVLAVWEKLAERELVLSKLESAGSTEIVQLLLFRVNWQSYLRWAVAVLSIVGSVLGSVAIGPKERSSSTWAPLPITSG